MATLILICGLPGAGKTTRAKQFEQRLAVRNAALPADAFHVSEAELTPRAPLDPPPGSRDSSVRVAV